MTDLDAIQDELSLIIAKARHGPGVTMDGRHNPRPSERDAARRFVEDHIAALLAEVDRLHSWDGLMELLDEHWPADIFPTLPDDDSRDPGPRIVSLLRWVDRLREGDAS